jgi:hypothetical protein
MVLRLVPNGQTDWCSEKVLGKASRAEQAEEVREGGEEEKERGREKKEKKKKTVPYLVWRRICVKLRGSPQQASLFLKVGKQRSKYF